jgi:hypothetical protein
VKSEGKGKGREGVKKEKWEEERKMEIKKRWMSRRKKGVKTERWEIGVSDGEKIWMELRSSAQIILKCLEKLEKIIVRGGEHRKDATC